MAASSRGATVATRAVDPEENRWHAAKDRRSRRSSRCPHRRRPAPTAVRARGGMRSDRGPGTAPRGHRDHGFRVARCLPRRAARGLPSRRHLALHPRGRPAPGGPRRRPRRLVAVGRGRCAHHRAVGRRRHRRGRRAVHLQRVDAQRRRRDAARSGRPARHARTGDRHRHRVERRAAVRAPGRGGGDHRRGRRGAGRARPRAAARRRVPARGGRRGPAWPGFPTARPTTASSPRWGCAPCPWRGSSRPGPAG